MPAPLFSFAEAGNAISGYQGVRSRSGREAERAGAID